MATPRYRDKSITDFMNIYAPSTDGNDTNAYINNVIALDHKWGGQSDRNTIVTGNRAPTTPQGGVNGRLPALTRGVGSVMQDIGPTPYSNAHPDTYAYGDQFGMHGHTGIDWAVPAGTQVQSIAGGVVTIAGGNDRDGYFYCDTNGCGAGQGQLRIRLDDGSELILGHMRNITVQVGQRINAGDLVGLSGGSDGDHIHVEYRIQDRSTPSGWRIVDPRAYFK
jgi:murein DD-endopeptidase MepM/ murein hydrolase activator NlpD